mmetsp:Transcript_37017/g.86779  ORF Transcript_37017/g.86779 Transcript_37017/m.86779 type:complete len:273 (+) Transcript_37017:231-1049(+)
MRDVSDTLGDEFERMPVDADRHPLRHQPRARAEPASGAGRNAGRTHFHHRDEFGPSGAVGNSRDAQRNVPPELEDSRRQRRWFVGEVGWLGRFEPPAPVHVHEGADMHGLGQRVAPHREGERHFFAPGRVCYLGNTHVEPPPPLVAVVDGDRVLMVPRTARVREQQNRPVCPRHPPRLVSREVVAFEGGRGSVQQEEHVAHVVPQLVDRLLRPPVPHNPLHRRLQPSLQQRLQVGVVLALRHGCRKEACLHGFHDRQRREEHQRRERYRAGR